MAPSLVACASSYTVAEIVVSHHRVQRLVIVLALGLTAVGCKDDAARKAPEAKKAAEEAPESKPESAEPAKLKEIDMNALMERHYTAAIAAHDALIRGDLGTLRAQLTTLGHTELPEGAPPAWEPFHQQLKMAGAAAGNVADAAGAAAAMGAVAEQCGTCHAGVGGKVEYGQPLPPEATMQSHQWATERLWEGITGPRPDSWERGTKLLADSKVFPQGAPSPELTALEEAFQTMAKEAQAAEGLKARGLSYGKLLATCASCHQQAKVPFDAK